jgi:archaemetzincin
MKPVSALIATLTFILLYSCNKHYDSFLLTKNKEKIIALQPLGDYDTVQLQFISRDISSFYNRKVIILPPVNIPETFRFSKDADLYLADSILDMLSELLNDEIIEIVGLTHKDIYILKKEKNKTANPLFDYTVQNIFGLGDMSGNCSIISDYRFNSTDTTLFKHRLRKVVLHEMDHNIGLDHCTFDQCIMSDKNAKLFFLDNSGNDYCNKCKSKLKTKGICMPGTPSLKNNAF